MVFRDNSRVLCFYNLFHLDSMSKNEENTGQFIIYYRFLKLNATFCDRNGMIMTKHCVHENGII